MWRYLGIMMAFDYLDSLRTIEIRIQIKTRQAQHLRDTMSHRKNISEESCGLCLKSYHGSISL